MEKVFDRKQREFYVEVDGRSIYIGTPAMFSGIAAQMIAHEAVAESKLKSDHTWCNIMTDDSNGTVIGVGYKIPFFCSQHRALERVKKSIQAYNG